MADEPLLVESDKYQKVFGTLADNDGNINSENYPVYTSVLPGVPITYSKQSANSDSFLINKGNLNKLRLRPRILNEQVESSKTLQATVTATNIVGQIFKASQDNINGIHIAGESAESIRL